jgi:hypothetical protein
MLDDPFDLQPGPNCPTHTEPKLGTGRDDTRNRPSKAIT